MKQILAYTISGIFGGLVVFGLSNAFNERNPEANLSNKKNTHFASYASPQMAVPVTGPDFVNAAKVSTPAVVNIHAEESDQLAARNRRSNPNQMFNFEDFFGRNFFGENFFKGKEGSGSGVIYTSDGYIITNNHVVGFADKITVTTSDGKKFAAKKIGTDPSSDLAVIKIEATGLQPVKFANSDNLKVGEWVLAVGNPFGYLTSTVTAGIVSAKGRDIDIIQGEKTIEEFIQTDAAINPGNSGGALVNSMGELVGINTAIATPTGAFAGYSFAIPTNLVKPIITSIIETGDDIERVSLGIGGYDVNDELRKDFDLKTTKGFYIEELDMKSPAKYAGILPGDVIVRIDGKDIVNYDDIEKALKLTKKGDVLQITVNRSGKEVTIPTKLKKGL